jgi:16S rRNA (cytosine1402-N4)-methyltransferase
MEKLHIPIMVKEILDLLKVIPGGIYADATFGEGGHTEAVLRAGAGKVLAFDRDHKAIERYRAMGEYRASPSLQLNYCLMSEMQSVLLEAPLLDGAVVDLGVSTRQLLESERGFSFQNEGPLDMRMDPESGDTLVDTLRRLDESRLTAALEHNVDLPGARKVARRIKDALNDERLNSTADLARIMGPKHGKRHPATPLFLALRMLVNEELAQLEAGIPLLIDRLRPGARLAVLTFHSNEDRAVKNLFKRVAGRCTCDSPPCHCNPTRIVSWVLKKPMVPSRQEERQNPRSRSAKLRCVEKIAFEE